MDWQSLLELNRTLVAKIVQGGGSKATQRQHAKQRLTSRERIDRLVDPATTFLEIGLWSAWDMYCEWGGAPAAGVVCGIAQVSDRAVMVIANDATIKAGAFFPMTVKKVLRAQRIAMDNHLPLLYLVDSAGVFLPLQSEVFPDEDDFGRIFRNNAVISAMGIAQIAAIMGNCVAGGGYLPVLCDKTIMTEGSGLYLAGPALVKSAIGQTVSHEELGGAEMHAAISGTIDFREANDEACLERLRKLVATLPTDPAADRFRRDTSQSPAREANDVYSVAAVDSQVQFDIRDVLDCFLDADSFQEYKAEFGKTIVCGYALLGGFRVGVVANQRCNQQSETEGIQFGGVIYCDSADKTARFVMDCNQTWTPLIFLQDVMGFMVGRDSERAGIIRSGAKLVNVVSNSRVPKLTVITGGSYGAGNYAMCGKAFDPRFIFAWPNARYAVMGGKQAATTLLDIQISALQKRGLAVDDDELEELRKTVTATYENSADIRYGAARGWLDGIIEPAETRDILIRCLEVATRNADERPFTTGTLQV
ncbi:MAG: methylcrotonoyl-CoA carboxylase [Planctomycetaceae bacterium]|nr:methylcrotonoyl-CoA carboxylase [Planctomycetaceae bacterium]